MYARVSGSVRILVRTMVYSARFSRRSPPRFRRCLEVLPEQAGIGQIPQSMANAASLRIRPGCDQTVKNTAAVTAPTPGRSSSSGAVDLPGRSEEHTSELQSRGHLVCRLLLEKKRKRSS